MELSESKPLVHFGVFELDLRAGELRKCGIRIKLQEQPFQILALLVSCPGEVVTREQIQKRLWAADTFVDVDNAINSAVRKMRDALGDNSDNPRFIETVARRGYRFIAPVNQNTDNAPAAVQERPLASAESTATGKLRSSRKVVVLCVAAVITGSVVVRVVSPGFLYRIQVKDHASSGDDTSLGRSPVPLTSYPGREDMPSFSPDGNQIAFSWDGPSQDNLDIYVKVIGQDEPVRLTKDPAADLTPAWSPDGRSIAFVRHTLPLLNFQGTRSALMLMPATGGPARKIADVWGPDRISWHPDGKWIVMSERSSPQAHASITITSVAEGTKRELTRPGPDGDDVTPVFAPDGRSIVFVRQAGHNVASDLYSVPLSDSAVATEVPRRITFDHRFTNYPVWTPDGRSIIYTAGTLHSPGLWRLQVSPDRVRGNAPERIAFAGYGVRSPTISRQWQLAFAQHISDADIWRLDLTGISHGPQARVPDAKLIASTRLDHTVQYSPDGKRLAFASERSGTHEIWVCNADGSEPVELTSFNGPYTGEPHWSPDGQWISFSSVPDHGVVYVISAQGGTPRSVTDPKINSRPGGWSRDGKYIYFAANGQIWKVTPTGGTPVQVAPHGDLLPVESPDGLTVYYLKGRDSVSSLWRVPATGGAEERQVLPAVYADNFAIRNNGVYFIADPNHASIQFMDFTTGKVSKLATPKSVPAYGMSISPDSRWALVPEYVEHGMDLMLVSNFR